MNKELSKRSKKVLFGTHNPSKIQRFRNVLKSFDMEFLSPRDINLPNISIDEDGQTETENSRIKAKAYYDLSKIPTISLDTGFYIHGLTSNQQPGRNVQRIAGVEETTNGDLRFDLMVAYYSQIANKAGGRVKAYFLDIFSLFDGQKFLEKTAKREVILTDKVFQKDINFPISSLYIVPSFNKYYHQLSAQEMSHYIQPSQEALYNLVQEYFDSKNTPLLAAGR